MINFSKPPHMGAQKKFFSCHWVDVGIDPYELFLYRTTQQLESLIKNYYSYRN